MKRVLLFVFVFLFNLESIAAPRVDAYESSYGIMGNTARQLRDQMNLFRVQETRGGFDADTQWNIKWHYDYLKSVNDCALTQSQVDLEIVYHLPQWKNEATAPAALRSKWNHYMEHLRIHETGHARNGEKAAWEIEALLKNLAPMPNCKVLEGVVNDRTQEILAEHNAWDAEYDKATAHGRTQGAVFP